MLPSSTSSYSAPPPPPLTSSSLLVPEVPSRPSSTTPMKRYLRDGRAVEIGGHVVSSNVSSPVTSEYANTFDTALPFQGSDSVMFEPPSIQQYQHLPQNQGHVTGQSRQSLDPSLGQNQAGTWVQQSAQASQQLQQALGHQQQQVAVKHLIQHQQLQQGCQPSQQPQIHPSHNPYNQVQQQQRVPNPMQQGLQQHQSHSSQPRPEVYQINTHTPRPNHQQFGPISHGSPYPSSIPPTPLPAPAPPVPKPIISEYGVMIPVYEPSTRDYTWTTVETYITRHVQAGIAAMLNSQSDASFFATLARRLQAEVHELQNTNYDLPVKFQEAVQRIGGTTDRYQQLGSATKLALDLLEHWRQSQKSLKGKLRGAEDWANGAEKLKFAADARADGFKKELGDARAWNGTLMLKMKALEAGLAKSKEVEAELELTRAQLQKANAAVEAHKQAQAGVMKRSDEMRKRNETLTEKIGELESAALLPMPSITPNPPSTSISTATHIERSSIHERELRKHNIKLTSDISEVRKQLEEFKCRNAQLITEMTKSKTVDRTDTASLRRRLKESQEAHAADITRTIQLEREIAMLVAQVRQLETTAAAAPNQPVPNGQIATASTALGIDLQVENGLLREELKRALGDLKQAQVDLKDARYPWDTMDLDDQQGEEGGGEKVGTAETIKARLIAFQSTIHTLQASNDDLNLQLDGFKTEREQKRVRDLHLKNSRELTKLQVQHMGDIQSLCSPEPSSPPHANDSTPHDKGDSMKVATEIREDKEEECKCGREAIIVELASRSEKVFIQALRIAQGTQGAMEEKLESSPLREREMRLRQLQTTVDYRKMVVGLVEHARAGVATR